MPTSIAIVGQVPPGDESLLRAAARRFDAGVAVYPLIDNIATGKEVSGFISFLPAEAAADTSDEPCAL